jgi:hypothetical protein
VGIEFKPVDKVGKNSTNEKTLKFNDLKASKLVCEPYGTELESNYN